MGTNFYAKTGRKEKVICNYGCEHIIDEETRLIVAVNCTLKENDVKFVFDGYRFSKILKNQGARIKETEEGAEIRFLPNSAVVFEIKSIS